MKNESFYLFESGQQMGPWSFDEVVRHVREGSVGPIVFVLSENRMHSSIAPTWKFLFDISEFREALIGKIPDHDPQLHNDKNSSSPIESRTRVSQKIESGFQDAVATTKSKSQSLVVKSELPGIAIVHNDHSAWTGKIFDLTVEGGTLALKGHHLKPGDRLFVHYTMPEDETKMVSFRVNIVEVTPLLKSTKYESERLVSFELVELNNELNSRIKQLIATKTRGSLAA